MAKKVQKQDAPSRSSLPTDAPAWTIKTTTSERYSSASKNTDSSVFYTEIETKILNTDSDPKNTDRDRDRYTANYSDLAMKRKSNANLYNTTKVSTIESDTRELVSMVMHE